MKKYIVEITEVLQKQIAIEAEDIEDAISIANGLYQNQNIILDDTDYKETYFEII